MTFVNTPNCLRAPLSSSMTPLARSLSHAASLLDDPYQIFSQYLAFWDALFPLHPLLWIRANGTVPTRAFSARFRTAFSDPSFGGHSLRSGKGGWSSSAWQRYIHRHPVLLRTLLFHGRPISLS
ncbi:hypothetical protein EDD17DRAFT_1591657 [Pisolithus thermaeus]|nr:hypothetical protein EDD17DRAFT_1591657 [Pisolithus thermaeus]